ncbi:MAG TPA: cupredoxin domain-containing protein [Actinomycetota bacterium]|nr:cupredoxin domain-containing protein [Actinomycetota bacterium]
MNQDLRERALLPVLIPIVAIIATEVLVFSMSRVLLAAGEQGAVVIALGVSVAILVGSAAVAANKRTRTASVLGLVTVVGLVAVAAGAVAMQRGPAYEREEAANLPEIEVSANNLAFDTKTLELAPSGAEIHFENADSQPHNIAIYPSASELNEPLFKGDIVPAGQKTVYKVGKNAPGEYYFQCDVHPTMNGKAVVEQGAGSAEHEGAHG